MSIASVGASLLPAAAPAASGAGSSTTAEPAATGFAALLAGAIAPQVQPAAAKPATKATSELGNESHADLSAGSLLDDATTDGTSDTTPAKTSSTDPSLAALGAAATGLNPLLKTKLARVIERMHSEFGRDVRLVEGVRSQTRQNQLFAQGRDTAGPVVTWTRNSLHTAGRAADLVINGGYDDATGFALLRQVAEQEGLHTLGAKDPGHVELKGVTTPADTATASKALNSLDVVAKSPLRDNLVVATSSVGRVASPASVTGVAQPAAVATVAAVARVATVARVAQLGAAAASAASRAAAATGATVKAEASVTPLAAPAGKPAGDNATSGENSSGADGDGQSAAQRRAPRASDSVSGMGSEREANAYRALDGTNASGTTGTGDAIAADALADARASTASRVSRAMDVQDAPGPRSITRLTLSLDDGNGGQDQVRVGMRGTTVGASFNMSSTANADRVSSRLGELTKALEQRGLEPQAFQVRAASTSREADAARVSTVAPGAQRAVAESAATRNDSQSTFGGDARQRFSHQSDQQEQSQRRLAEQRRRGSSFSLNSEES